MATHPADSAAQVFSEPPSPTISWGALAPPPEHLDSAKYWGAASAPSSVNEPRPSHGFYLAPVLQAPSWDEVPTYAADQVPQSSSESSGPTSWAMPVLPPEYLNSAKYWGVGPLPSGASEPPPAVPQTPNWDFAPTYPADRAAQVFSTPPSPTSWGASAPPLEHLDSGKYWPWALAPSGANDQRLAHGFNFLPVPQTPSRSSVPTHSAVNTAQIPPVTSIPVPTQYPATTVSDADPEVWLPGRRYAQSPPRRGARGPGGRDLSPMEEIHISLYNGARRTLQELDPRNPQLQSLSTSNWVPSNRDINQLNGEIARVRRERGLSELEPHHNLPRQFHSNFNKAGIDVDDYIVYMQRSEHRLLPNGLHTGSNHWNAQWKRFFAENPNATPEQIFEHANNMLRQLPR